MDKKHPICDACFFVNFGILKTIIPLHPYPFRECIKLYIYIYIYIIAWVTCIAGSKIFCFNPPKYLSLDRALNFQTHIGIHLSKMGDKLIHYYISNEKIYPWHLLSYFSINLLLFSYKHSIPFCTEALLIPLTIILVIRTRSGCHNKVWIIVIRLGKYLV